MSEFDERVHAEITAAYACDREGRESDAVVHYDTAYALGVPEQERAPFLLGYGSTLKNVGRLRESEAILREALAEAPNDPALLGFLALTLGAADRSEAALAAALEAILALPPASVGAYARALSQYKDELTAAASVRRPRLSIQYCPGCRWAPRACWIALELVTTFGDELEVLLSPGASGVFDVRVDGELIFSRASAQRFPEPKELKQAVRDRAFPGRALGHSDG